MNPIVKLAASALPGEKKYVLFAGAGVSKDAGIPTAWDLVLEIASLLYAGDNETGDPNVNLEEWFMESEYAQMGYAKLMENLYPNHPAQQSFLNKYLGNREIGLVHREIAELARREIIRAIVTTNFDPYIERALEEKGLVPQVISTDEDLKNSEPLIHCKGVRIYKPHGTLGRGALKNTSKDLEKLSPLMEKELVRVLSEHGVIVLGYSGRDKCIQRVFRDRSCNHYLLFWVNPQPPEGKIESILKEDYIYIPCTGASQFIDDFFRILERSEDRAPAIGSGPTVSDMKYAFSSSNEPIAPLYSKYLKSIFDELERIRPDFSKFEHYDDAIFDQIDRGQSISYGFIEAALLASKYDNEEIIRAIYDSFGNFLRLYNPPNGFVGSFHKEDFDGYRFLVYEMFVAFIATLIKHSRWEAIGNILEGDLLTEREDDNRWRPFVYINKYIKSLDGIRNQRLKLRKLSVMAGLLKKRFSIGDLSELIEHEEFLEADYFLYMRTVCHESLPNWHPWSCVYLQKLPSYLVISESRRFLDNMVKAVGFEKKEDFIQKFRGKESSYTDSVDIDATILFYNFNIDKLGTRT